MSAAQPAATDEIGARWHELRLLQWQVNETLEHALQEKFALSLSEYIALATLDASDDDGHLRQQVLAAAIPLNQSSLSRLVARLEKAGLTERYMCATDRRGVYTQITPAGRALVARARRVYQRVLHQALDTAADDAQLTHLVDKLRHC
ncbi:MarR family winged helix-turn-helix transcriptional regulator [Micromonospora rosaria]|uniref:MarR family winged helix-turn-helix transcriptional regulator n=1 Tax=Micromonospora rosaria TaxID=47874 RepID=UPI0008378874|nr:MarR family transcriptional regulator [Micromonospora rosaria]